MVQATVSRPEIDPEIAALLNEWEQERPRALDPEALAYLALVPTWTRRLAERCSFPLRKPWDEFLAGAEAAGLVQQQPAEADDEQQADLLRFWMPEAARAGALQQVVEALHRDYLVDLAVRLGGTISGLDPDDPAVPAITRRWAEMAREVGPGRQMAEKAIVQIERQPGAADSSAAARVLFQRVTELVDRRETELADKRETGEARVWIDAGELLAAAVGGRLVDVVELAKRRVELSYREDVDRRYLTRFVERPEQLAAFHELMTGPDHLWALHYLGMGGVGKTMLLRHIGHLAPGDAYHSPVARVDFDYLNPDYPARRPGELLLALAEELRRHFSAPEHQRAYVKLRDSLDYLSEIISGEPPPADPLLNLHRPEFEQALDLFAALLKSLLRTAEAARQPDGPPARVVFVLDTCEELVKSLFSEGALPHLKATFEFIERVHDLVPAVRVILAGRRLLALGGDGWQVAADRLPRAKSYLLPAKPYLRLHLIRGFDQDRAQQLFARFETSERPLPAEVRQAILSASADYGTPAALQAGDGRPWLFPAPLYERLRAALDTPFTRSQLDALVKDKLLGPALRPLVGAPDPVASAIEVLSEKIAPDGRNLLLVLLAKLSATDRSAVPAGLAAETELLLTRYSPFSLSIFSQWYADDRKLTVADIRAGKDDRYVELRIVGRIKQEDRRLLPAVVLLRRFDARMLALGFTGSPGDFEASFRALSDHEWLNYRRDPQTDEIWLEVDPNFYPRLRAYFDRVEPAALDSARRALGPKLAESVRSPGLSGRASEEIAAALALLPDAEAAQLWSEVEWRVPEEADWSWGLRVTGLALAAEADAVPGSRPLVFAALSATQAAANIHLSPTYNPAEAWRDVAAALAQLTARGSAAPLARWLAARAALGQTAAAGVNTIRTLLAERAAGAGRLGSLPSYLGAQLDAALLAALEKLVDVAEETSDRSLLGAALDLDLDTFAKRALSPAHHAFALLLKGRIEAQHGNHWSAAREAMISAEALAASAALGEWKPDRWADWHAPASLLHRIRLEWLRLWPDLPEAGSGQTPEEQLAGWLRDLAAGKALDQIDGERLASAALARLLDLEPVPADLLDDLEKAYRYDPARQPVCLAHRPTPPLFLALARGRLALGDPARGEKLLLAVQESATASARDAPSVDAAQQGLVEIARRTRDAERARPLVAGQATRGWPLADAWALAALTGVQADQLPEAAETWDDARLHARWRAQHGPDLGGGGARGGGPPPPPRGGGAARGRAAPPIGPRSIPMPSRLHRCSFGPPRLMPGCSSTCASCAWPAAGIANFPSCPPPR